MKRLVITFTFCITLQSFGQNQEISLKEYFSEAEIEDLNRIADFFQKELCGKVDRSQFASCFLESLPKNELELFTYYVSGQINYRKQRQLYENLKDSTFFKIWALCPTSILVSEPPYEYQALCFSHDLRTMAYFHALGKNNEYIKHYAERLDRVGHFESSSILIQNILGQTQNWDLSDRSVQIFLAIHFITKNDSQNRDKKAIRLEKRYDRVMIKKLRRNKSIP